MRATATANEAYRNDLACCVYSRSERCFLSARTAMNLRLRAGRGVGDHASEGVGACAWCSPTRE